MYKDNKLEKKWSSLVEKLDEGEQEETRSGHTWDLSDRSISMKIIRQLLGDFEANAKDGEPAELEAIARVLDDAYGEYRLSNWWEK
jgi:hypothetical protein